MEGGVFGFWVKIAFSGAVLRNKAASPETARGSEPELEKELVRYRPRQSVGASVQSQFGN